MAAKKNPSGKRSKTLAKRTADMKAKLLQHLAKTPMIQAACLQSGIGRSTYYEWASRDEAFAKLAKASLREGRELVSEAAESQLIRRIKEGHMTAIIFWLKNNDGRYSDRSLHEHTIEVPRLTKEQADQLQRAVTLAGLAGVLDISEKARKHFVMSDDAEET